MLGYLDQQIFLRSSLNNILQSVAYLSLRVAVQQIKCKRVRRLPPTHLGPLSIQTAHLDVHRHLSPLGLLKQPTCRNLRRNSRLVRSNREVVRTTSPTLPSNA